MSTTRPRVLFACVGNAGRSQLAEALCRSIAGDRIECRSGGSRPAGAVAAETFTVLREKGIDITGAQPKGFDEAWVRGCDLIVTMGCGDDACPAFVGKRIVDWDLEDPNGRDLAFFRFTRDEIERRVHALVSELAPSTRRTG